MIHHRHTRGVVLDLNSEVCPASYLENTKIASGADVYISRLHNSWVEQSNIVRTAANHCKFNGSTTILSTVEGSQIVDSKVYDTNIQKSILTNVNCRGSFIKDCNLSNCWIGQASLDGLDIHEDMRIGVGHWTRAPRFFTLNDDIVQNVGVTESTNGWAYVGCTARSMSQWIKGKKRYQRVMGWSSEMMDYIESNFREWMRDTYGGTI